MSLCLNTLYGNVHEDLACFGCSLHRTLQYTRSRTNEDFLFICRMPNVIT